MKKVLPGYSFQRNLKSYPRKLLKSLLLKVLVRTSCSPRLIACLMMPYSLFRAAANYRQWPGLLRYKQHLGCNMGNTAFLVQYFSRRQTTLLLGILYPENPQKFLRYVRIEGGEVVRQISGSKQGALVLSGHDGPLLLKSFLFKEVLHIPMGSFSGKRTIKNKEKRLKPEEIALLSPLYLRGQERALLKGLLKGEWINFLNDLVYNRFPDKLHPYNCILLDRPVRMSEFPFRISLKYHIPLIFAGITYSSKTGLLTFRIQQANPFHTPVEGLMWFVDCLKRQLIEDPFSNSYIPIKIGQDAIKQRNNALR